MRGLFECAREGFGETSGSGHSCGRANDFRNDPLLFDWIPLEGNPLRFHWTPMAVAGALLSGDRRLGGGVYLYYWLVQHMDVTNTMLIALVTPVVAVTLGMLVLKEEWAGAHLRAGPMIMSGIAIIVLGGRLFQRRCIDDHYSIDCGTKKASFDANHLIGF